MTCSKLTTVFTLDGRSGHRRTRAGAMPAHVPARPGRARRQEGLRRRRLRRMHRVARRRAGAFLPDPGISRGRTHRHDDPGPGSARQSASDAEGLPRGAGIPVRLLRGRHDHDRRLAHRGAEGGSPARAEGQSLSLHRLSLDLRCHPRHLLGRSRHGRTGLRCQPGQSVQRGHRDRPRPLYDGRCRGGPAAPEGAALATCPCPHCQHRQDPRRSVAGRGRDLHLGGRTAPPLQHRHA